MGNIASWCQLILDEGSSESIKSNGLVLASKPAIKSIRIPLSQLSLSDVIVEGEVEDVWFIQNSYKWFVFIIKSIKVQLFLFGWNITNLMLHSYSFLSLNKRLLRYKKFNESYL